MHMNMITFASKVILLSDMTAGNGYDKKSGIAIEFCKLLIEL